MRFLSSSKEVSVNHQRWFLVWFHFHIRLCARLIAHLIIQQTQQHQTSQIWILLWQTLFRHDECGLTVQTCCTHRDHKDTLTWSIKGLFFRFCRNAIHYIVSTVWSFVFWLLSYWYRPILVLFDQILQLTNTFGCFNKSVSSPTGLNQSHPPPGPTTPTPW